MRSCSLLEIVSTVLVVKMETGSFGYGFGFWYMIYFFCFMLA